MCLTGKKIDFWKEVKAKIVTNKVSKKIKENFGLENEKYAWPKYKTSLFLFFLVKMGGSLK